MDFANLRRVLAESGVYRRMDEVIAFITYRDVREMRVERSPIKPDR
jgi:hypothetical protein